MIKTGFPRIDSAIGPIPGRSITLIAGEAKSGFSTVLNQFVMSNVREKRITYIELEGGMSLGAVRTLSRGTENLQVVSLAEFTPERFLDEATHFNADILIIDRLGLVPRPSTWTPRPGAQSSFETSFLWQLRQRLRENVAVVTSLQFPRRIHGNDSDYRYLVMSHGYICDTVFVTKRDGCILNMKVEKSRFSEVLSTHNISQDFLPWRP